MILTPLQKLPINVCDLGKIIVATGFEWSPKVQKCPIWSHWLRVIPLPTFKLSESSLLDIVQDFKGLSGSFSLASIPMKCPPKLVNDDATVTHLDHF